MIMAGAGGVIATILVVRGNYENAFVAAASGAVCWFLNYRQHIRETLDKEEEQTLDDDEADEEVHS
jgi:hypothetical protein